MMETNSNLRSRISDKRRIVIKVGSSSLVHENTGEMDFVKLEQLVRLLCDLRNQDKDIILVSSGAIGVGRKALGLEKRPDTLPLKQACASVGQAVLMMCIKSFLVNIIIRHPDFDDKAYNHPRGKPF